MDLYYSLENLVGASVKLAGRYYGHKEISHKATSIRKHVANYEMRRRSHKPAYSPYSKGNVIASPFEFDNSIGRPPLLISLKRLSSLLTARRGQNRDCLPNRVNRSGSHSIPPPRPNPPPFSTDQTTMWHGHYSEAIEERLLVQRFRFLGNGQQRGDCQACSSFRVCPCVVQ